MVQSEHLLSRYLGKYVAQYSTDPYSPAGCTLEPWNPGTLEPHWIAYMVLPCRYTRPVVISCTGRVQVRAKEVKRGRANSSGIRID